MICFLRRALYVIAGDTLISACHVDMLLLPRFTLILRYAPLLIDAPLIITLMLLLRHAAPIFAIRLMLIAAATAASLILIICQRCFDYRLSLPIDIASVCH